MGRNLSELLEKRLREVGVAQKRLRWLEENADAFAAYEKLVKQHGVFNEGEREW